MGPPSLILLESRVSDTRDHELEHTPLFALHQELGGRMVPFAGYAMPVQYTGIIEEHQHTRKGAALFDVSHMGQARLQGVSAPMAMERLAPGEFKDLAAGRMRYTVLTNERGGIIDDLMVVRRGDHLFLVVNAARKKVDFAHIAASLEGGCRLDVLAGQALLALQGPLAVEVLARFVPAVRGMPFMSAADVQLAGTAALVTRSGYTGEDGFEISLAAEAAEGVARRLLAEPEVRPVGLGARDSLRLEAGLCLYGSDIDEETTPVEAGLAWVVGKRRRAEGGFPGSGVILDEIAKGPRRRRVGLVPEGKAIARAHTAVLGEGGETVGEITSGGYGPSVGGPVAMGYVRADCARAGTRMSLPVRGQALPARVAALPFVPHRYVKT